MKLIYKQETEVIPEGKMYEGWSSTSMLSSKPYVIPEQQWVAAMEAFRTMMQNMRRYNPYPPEVPPLEPVDLIQ